LLIVAREIEKIERVEEIEKLGLALFQILALGKQAIVEGRRPGRRGSVWATAPR
jgi:hypothetical protein